MRQNMVRRESAPLGLFLCFVPQAHTCNGAIPVELMTTLRKVLHK